MYYLELCFKLLIFKGNVFSLKLDYIILMFLSSQAFSFPRQSLARPWFEERIVVEDIFKIWKKESLKITLVSSEKGCTSLALCGLYLHIFLLFFNHHESENRNKIYFEKQYSKGSRNILMPLKAQQKLKLLSGCKHCESWGKCSDVT